MTRSSLSSETLHASCVAKQGCAVLICGRSGAGKSDLALRLIDRGATLVSDDYTIVRRVDGTVEEVGEDIGGFPLGVLPRRIDHRHVART